MAEEYCGGANWWESSSASRSRFDGASGSSGGGGGGGRPSTSSTTTTLANGGGGCGYGWLTDSTMAVDINATARSSLDPVAPTASSTFQDTKIDASSLQLAGLGLSSQGIEWNQQPLLRNPEKADNSFRAMLQEGMGLNPNFQHDQSGGSAMFDSQLQWRDKLFGTTNEDSSEFKQIARGFSLDHQPQFSPSSSSMESTVTCQQGLTASTFTLDSTSSSTLYGSPPSSILQGFVRSDQQQLNYQQNYLGLDTQQSQLSSSWAKVPQFLRSAPTQFTTTAPYLNVDVRPSLLATLQPQVPMPTFEEKPKLQSTMEVRDTSSTAAKKGGTENNTKRARTDTATSTLPPFKVRKEKMGDRITALQQLVSPFGKTDTASVLSEAIEYIKFLHEQVSVLSTPYLKSGAASYQQHQQGGDKAKVDPDGPKQDLRSRGLCLVPVSSTFPVTHEATVDFWTPTFGGTFR